MVAASTWMIAAVRHQEEVTMIDVDVSQYDGITEFWEVNSHTVEVITDDHRRIRLAAHRNMRSADDYTAHWEELVEVEVGDRSIGAWVPVNFPWETGESIDDLVRKALRWVASKHERDQAKPEVE